MKGDRPAKVPQRSRRHHATADPPPPAPLTIAIEIITARAAHSLFLCIQSFLFPN